jgi:6-phosphogluconolactonase
VIRGQGEERGRIMMTDKYELKIFDSYESLSEGALRLFMGSLIKCIDEKGVFTVALPGGRSPGGLLSLLVDENIKWEKVHIFFTDERCVSPEDPRSNYRLLRERFFSRIDIPDRNIHRIRGELTPEKGADDYEAVLRRELRGNGFDLAVFGMGEDGHIGSLFPGSPALDERARWAVAVSEAPVSPRVSVTPCLIDLSREVLLIVSGDQKAEAFRMLRDDTIRNESCPAKMLLSHRRLHLFTDVKI